MYTQPMLKEGSLKGKTIIVTGGGTGLGKSMDQYFLELGANLNIAGRKAEIWSMLRISLKKKQKA